MSDSSNPSELPEISPETPKPRKVYESSLNLERRRRRVSPWITLPILFVVFGIYIFIVGMHRRHVINTAGQIVFAANSGPAGASQLFVIAGSGGQPRPLTSGQGNDSSPVFSPDGYQIAFLSLREKGLRQVFIMDADGANIIGVTHNSGTKGQLAFAPNDSQTIGYISAGKLFKADTTGGDAEQVAPSLASVTTPAQSTDASADASPLAVSSFAWRPAASRDDQGLAAVEESNGIQQLAILPNPQAKLIETMGGQPNGPPLVAADNMTLGWNRDGGLLAVAVRGIKNPEPGHSNSGIFLFDAQGSKLNQKGPVRIVQATVGPENPVFSPDGSHIACEIWNQPNITSRECVGLFLAPLGGSTPPSQIYSGDAGSIQFSNDGGSIYFLAKNHDGKHDLCRVGVDGSNLQHITDGKSDITSFSVSPQAPH